MLFNRLYVDRVRKVLGPDWPLSKVLDKLGEAREESTPDKAVPSRWTCLAARHHPHP
jgi:hypothetical protein